MNIIVCIKQVPDTNEVKIDKKTNTLIRDGVPSIINPDDKAALESALKLKSKYGGRVTVITMGPPQADYALREALAIGADEAILISSRSFAGSDTLATSLVLSKAIEKIKDFDLVFCGRQAIDGDTAQVGPEIAEHLDLPQVTYVQRIIEVKDELVIVERALEDGFEELEVKLPALLTAVKELEAASYPNMGRIIDAFDNMSVECWSEKDFEIDLDRLGLKGSPTQVVKTFTPEPKGQGIIVEGETDREKVISLIGHLEKAL